jgi:hypothetical protein
MAVKKHEIVSYVLVPDVCPGSKLWYFTGIVKPDSRGPMYYLVPVNTDKYDEALKLCFKDEAEQYCESVNGMFKSVKFHVEEHMYAYDTPDKIQEAIDRFQKENNLNDSEMTRLLEHVVRMKEKGRQARELNHRKN